MRFGEEPSQEIPSTHRIHQVSAPPIQPFGVCKPFAYPDNSQLQGKDGIEGMLCDMHSIHMIRRTHPLRLALNHTLPVLHMS